jgi:hypothetical protein
MGKGKSKKAAPTAIGQEFSNPTTASNGDASHNGQHSSDSIDLEGLTEEHLEEYTKLLHERARLEKEKEELEKKSARYHAERALLNEDSAAFDRLFKLELGGEYKFSGGDMCCLDLADDQTPHQHSQGSHSVCQHELCARAKAKGISWREMDTLRLYRTRITQEKSHRMKNALRKQRHVDLVRVKKEDEEEGSLRNRRSTLSKKLSKIDPGLMSLPENADALLKLTDPALLEAAKENDVIVKNIRSRLDKIRQDVYTGKLTAKDARAKLEQASQEMVEMERSHSSANASKSAGQRQDSTSTPSSATLAHELTSNLIDTSPEIFSKALDIVKNFLSATDIADVHSVIAELRHVFELSGAMPPDIDKKLKDVKSLLDDPSTKRIDQTLSIDTGKLKPDGTKLFAKFRPTDVAQMLIALRSKGDKELLKKTCQNIELDDQTRRDNDAAIVIERDAYSKMVAFMDTLDHLRLEVSSPEIEPKVFSRLEEIRAHAVENSPIPAITDFVLENRAEILLASFIITRAFNRTMNTEKFKRPNEFKNYVAETLQKNRNAKELGILWPTQAKSCIREVLDTVTKSDRRKQLRFFKRLVTYYQECHRAKEEKVSDELVHDSLEGIRVDIANEVASDTTKTDLKIEEAEDMMMRDAPTSQFKKEARKKKKDNTVDLITAFAEQKKKDEKRAAIEAKLQEAAGAAEKAAAEAAKKKKKKKPKKKNKPKVKEVSVGTPQIEEAPDATAQTSNGVSETASTNELSNDWPNTTSDFLDETDLIDKGKGKAKGPLQVTIDELEAAMSPSELVWVDQLNKLADNMLRLMELEEGATDIVQQVNALAVEKEKLEVDASLVRMTRKLQEQMLQHEQNCALTCSLKPEYWALKAWLKEKFGFEREESEDEDEE